MSGDGGGIAGKGPSNKELKKLAKKAEKAGKKAGARANELGGASAAAASAPEPTRYHLANASDGCASTVKAAVASAAFGIPLHPCLRAPSDLTPLLHGPALLTDLTGAVGATSVAFGGNGVAKALSLLTEKAGAGFNADVDEWLELERTQIRPALASGNAKKIAAALSKVETALELNGGAHLVGDALTAADVAVAVTLTDAAAGEGIVAMPPSVRSYVDLHDRSDAFVSGRALVSDLIPPPPLDVTDPSLLAAVSAVFTESIASALPAAAGISFPSNVFARCKDLKNGDYQCNAAMQLFQKLKGKLPPGINAPQQVAQAIIDATPAENPVLDTLTVNGPGFIMCRIKASFLQIHMDKLISSGECPHPRHVTTGTTVVDFSSPNIAKEMHVGHLRSTIIGEAVCRVLEYVGNKVHRVNHVGDWGTQFGMLIQELKEEFPDFQDNVPNITDLTEFYKNAKKRFDEDPEFKKTSQLNVVKLQSGDEECLGIWKILCDVSRHEFEKVYERLDISTEECGESFYNDKIPAVIKEFEGAGMVSVEEGGAKCVFVPKFKIPLMLQKSDGGYGYDSTDVAALKYRLFTLGARRIVVVTDFGQGDHFKMCYAAAEKIGWVDQKKHSLEHIGFGTVQGEDGKRFKTRSGDTVRLVDLLDEAVNRMEASLNERIKEDKANISLDEVHKTACALGYGAVKYFDLRRNPTTNYIFSYDRMLDTKGNTAIYLLYAHARLESICAKGKTDFNVDVDDLMKGGKAKILLGHPSERNLALHLQMFADTIEMTLDDLFPYHICDFLYNASIAVSEFVTQCKVLGSPEMESRLLLCRATAIVMRQCFDLLGIRHVMRI